jgi:hypothetical protein
LNTTGVDVKKEWNDTYILLHTPSSRCLLNEAVCTEADGTMTYKLEII